MKIIKLLPLIILAILFTNCETISTTNCDDEYSFTPKTDSIIIFISWRTANSEDFSLCSMNLDGTQQEKITDLTIRCERPVISHSGEIILFVHDSEDHFYELYSINIDGTSLTLIDRAKRYCGSPDWSIDDSKIIYSKSRNESTDDRDIILFDVSTNTKKTLTEDFNNLLARFSKDNKIAFWQQNDTSNDIYIMDSDGSNKQKILTNASYPVWSPGGNRIAYISPGTLQSPQIFISCADGSNSTQLTDTYFPNSDSGFRTNGNSNPLWTPDGKKIVYLSYINEGLPEVYIMNCDGTNQKRLTNTDGRNEDPEISSDGRLIYFTSSRDPANTFDIYVMEISGGNQYALSKYPGYECNPVLSRK